MTRLHASRTIGLFSAILLGWAAAAGADWQLGDPVKMHFPQLPDPTGWDVDITQRWVADDWQCNETGPVSDLHFWISFRQDYFYGNDPQAAIDSFWVRFYTDVPAGGANNPVPYSHPSQELLREYRVPAGAFRIVGPMTGPQGWFTPDPQQPIAIRPDHDLYFQVNIPKLEDPFIQKQGEVYWVALHAVPANPPGGEIPLIGWKTSIEHFLDDAVYDITSDVGVPWAELYDPLITDPAPVSLDMAFVITPEPASLALLGIGGLVLLRRR